jgi:hypothetical protein
MWCLNYTLVVPVQVRSCLSSVWIMYTNICLYLCDPKRSRTANMLALLILYNRAYIYIMNRKLIYVI